jgi:uncharacterized protein (UPF0264 family)
LVSVRSVPEAEAALAGGADLIDLKEPSLGSLAPVSSNVAAAVADQIQGRSPLSMALGELSDLACQRPSVPAGVAFVKLGLAGMARLPDWRNSWRRALAPVPRGVARVAVIYADWSTCEAPAPDAILSLAGDERCAAVLVDTYDKSRGDVFSYLLDEELGQLAAQARSTGAQFVLAGSLRRETIARAAAVGPDYIAVRGAVCRGPRTGAIDRSRVREIKVLLAAATRTEPAARASA